MLAGAARRPARDAVHGDWRGQRLVADIGSMGAAGFETATNPL
jgi:hypothetical protein